MIRICPGPSPRAICALLMALTASAASAQAPATQVTSDAVLHSLQHTVDWYHRMTGLNTTVEGSREITLQNSLRHNSRQALRLGFDFAKAESTILAAADENPSAATKPAAATAASSSPADRNRRLAQLAATAAQRIVQLQSDVDRLNSEIQKAPNDAVPLLTARRTELVSELNLAKVRGDVLKNLLEFSAGQDAGNGSLAGQVADLERSVPDVAAGGVTAAPGDPTATNSSKASTEGQGFHVESVGIVGLVSQMFSLSREMSELKSLADATERLRASNEKLRLPIRAELTDAIHRADALVTARPKEDAARLNAQSQQVDALTARFRQLAAASVPLGEQITTLETARAELLEWHDLLGHQYARIIRSLLFRLSTMGIAIAVVLVLSALWQRATFHYITDVRRRRQFLLVRRIVVACVLAIIVAAGFITEIASLATFAGIMTAGIAVALQTLILSGVAYFFFIGRYGVRAGDRVTVGGITGDVIETGLFRLYLMELGGINHLQPTGRVVVFSNSVLFQPAGFFKQLPGADYIWQESSIKLPPGGDSDAAERKLLAAANAVFETYRDQIDNQHAAAGAMVHAQLPSPRPQGRLKVSGGELEFIVRYPVPIRQSEELEDRIAKALLEASRG